MGSFIFNAVLNHSKPDLLVLVTIAGTGDLLSQHQSQLFKNI